MGSAEAAVERADEAADGSPRSELVLSGHRTGCLVDGAVLEAALQCDNGWLVFMSDDVPFEEVLSIHLVASDGLLLDTAWIGGAYATGQFAALTVEAQDRVRFRFIGDADWQVQVLPQPRLRVPLVSDAPGVHRRVGFTRHFIVKGRP